MKRSLNVFCLVMTVCAFCSTSPAQTNPTVSEFDGNKQKAPFELTQKTDVPQTDGAPNPNQDKVVEKKPTPPPVGKQRRAELMEFVNAHHPEIRPLLRSLQKNRPAYYQSALRALDREIKHLQALQQKSPERYKKSLEQWVAKSKIKLLSAQLAIKKSEQEKISIQKKLKVLIEKQHDMRVQQLVDDVAQTKKRLERIESTLADLNANRDNEVKRHLDVIIKNSERISTAQRKAAEKKAADANKKSDKNTPRKTNPTTPSVDQKKKPRSEDDKANPKDK